MAIHLVATDQDANLSTIPVYLGHMAADQHAQPFPGIGLDTRRSAQGGGISAGE